MQIAFTFTLPFFHGRSDVSLSDSFIMTAAFDEYEYLERQLQSRRNGSSERDRDRRHSSDRGRKHRHRSVSPPRSKSRRRSRSPPPDDRSRHRSSGRERSRSPKKRERTPPEVRIQREQERELKELERATRTVFAYNLNIKADSRDLFEFFSKAGKVTDIRIITDRNTRKSKGLAYIEFSQQEEVFNALALTGQVLMGQAVMVKASEAEKNLAWEAQQVVKQSQAEASALLNSTLGGGTGPLKLQVTNLRPDISEADLRQIFEPFGAIDFLQLVRDATGKSVGYGYVTFKLTQDGMRAMQHWNGKVLADSVLSVTVAAVVDAPTATVSELDEDEENFKLNSQARAALMNRLANSAGLQPSALPQLPAAPQILQPQIPTITNPMYLEQGVLGPASPKPTPCLLLKNMFDPTESQGEPGWDEEIAADVKEECSKFGIVNHIHVDPKSQGFVYLKFDSIDGAQSAQRALHGRWYSGHQIVAEYQFLQVYNNHFKC